MTARTFISLAAAATMVATSFGVAAPAMARDHYRDYRGHHASDYRYRDNRRDYRSERRYDRRHQDRRHYSYNCRDNGTGGTIIGAIAGGLLGHEVAGRRGDKTAGVLIGGAVGAVAGRAIDKADSRC